jgi:hypothetical protein
MDRARSEAGRLATERILGSRSVLDPPLDRGAESARRGDEGARQMQQVETSTGDGSLCVPSA